MYSFRDMRKKFKLISGRGDLVERNEKEVMLVPVVGSGTVCIGRESGIMRSFFFTYVSGI
jgi:hypothetical protein